MTWPTGRFNNWAEFTSFASGFRFGDPITFANLLRGQPDASWPIKSSLSRLISPGTNEDAALQIEAGLLREFKSHVRNHLSGALIPSDESTIEWWALMAHHGAPTRLIDWSGSPYVAAYFAAIQCPDRDGAIWVIHPHSLLEALGQAVGRDTPLDPLAEKAGGPKLVTPVLATRKTERMIAQQGQFTIGLNILTDQESAIDNVLKTAAAQRGECLHMKMIVPRALKPEFLDQLRGMNVTANALFPGIDGLGRSLAELARIAFERA